MNQRSTRRRARSVSAARLAAALAQGTAESEAEQLERGEYGWFDGNSGGKTQRVGQKKANAWGLFDMHGNVWELCSDWYGDYPEGAVTDPQGPPRATVRVSRGGSWYNPATYWRSAYRCGDDPAGRYDFLGFRLALGPPGDPS